MIRVMQVCGARPNFVKTAPLVRAYDACAEIECVLVHTGQHYDRAMSGSFFDELGLREPDVNLGVGSGSHAAQTAGIMAGFEPVVVEHRPDWVVVVGDVNSTIACALVATKLGVRVAHVEAGLRSFDRRMPEEVNRLLTDAISDLLFVSERSGLGNLRREGVHESKVCFVGNVMIDSLEAQRERAMASRVHEELRLEKGSYVVVTLHRPSNVDDPATLRSIFEALLEIGGECPVVFAAHPRTQKGLASCQKPDGADLRILEPLGYHDFLCLMSEARAVITDSGGMQEETTVLGVPCLTVRRNTERPVTIEQGTNHLVDPRRDAVLSAWGRIRDQDRRPVSIELWDGKTAPRIVDCLLEASRPPTSLPSQGR